MTSASLPNLTHGVMTQLSNNKIRILNLASNNISRLESDTFADFPNLMFLDLSGNQIPVKHLQIGLKSINSLGLKTLVLERMGLTTLPDNFFEMFTSRSLDRISLAENHLTSFNSAVFAPFEKIGNVNLRRNQMFRVNISTRQSIAKLNLGENIFFNFPDLCLYDSTGSSTNTFPGLRSLHMDINNFRRIPSDVLRGICFPHLVKLDISASQNLYKLENNFISQLPRFERLLADRSRFAKYEPFAFNSSSLKRLSLNDNRAIKSWGVDVNHLFKHCPKLEELSISDTNLKLSDTELRQLLLPLTSLRTLSLYKVSRGTFPGDLLWRLPKLEKLDIAANSFSSAIIGQALWNVTSIRKLNIRANSITVVNDSTLPWPFRKHLTNLDLSHNPFSCQCDLRWFQRWLEDVELNKSIEIAGYWKNYVCQTPQKRKGVQVMDVRFTEEECGERSLALTLGVAGGCLLAALCLLAGLVYRYRWYLRFYLYRYRRRRHDGQGTELIQFDFDVYLAHSSEDVHWVCQQLVPLLEEDHGLRTFLPDRDTVPGTVMAENITRFMDNSSRILLLISDTYVREEWRLFEFQHIVYAAVDQQKDVIVVLLGDVEAGRLTKEMTRMLTRGTFLQWGSSEEAQRVFREGLRVALKTEDNSFQTMC
ncbi:toll-like receptor 2 [Babylonia areolata]|uniref:toll-like receptor 2 n=1 Tax=Babylonia areolata TaxID=304850 RepID=UPI003FCFC660